MHEHERTSWVFSVFQAQEFNRFRGQTDDPGAAFVLHQLPPFHRAFLSDGQRPFFYIQVAPLQGNQFSLPKSRRQRQQEHGEVAQPLRCVQIVLHF